MAYLPGVPDAGPSPVSTMAGGKPGRVQHLGSIVGRRGAGMSAGTGGNPALHSLGHYGKKSPPLLGGMQSTGGVDPTSHAGVKMIRGGGGQIRSHVREGGLGPGPMSTPGASNTNYSIQPSDSE